MLLRLCFTFVCIAALGTAAAGCAQSVGEVCQLGTALHIREGRGSDCEAGLICCKPNDTVSDRGICRTPDACDTALATDSGPPVEIDAGDGGGGDAGAGEDAGGDDAGDGEDAAMSVDSGTDGGPDDGGPDDAGPGDAGPEDAGAVGDDAGVDGGP